MQLIIPMSGLGVRFLKQGYKVPKPLIKVEGFSIISHVVNMFPGIKSVIFICNENHLLNKELNLKNELLNIREDAKIFSIKQHKKGPIYAVLKIIDEVNLELPTIVNYCDFNSIWNFNNFKNHVFKTNCDGCVVTYSGFHPHMISNKNYAYVKLKNNRICDIQEKKPFTKEPTKENASSGTYYFKTAKLMKKYFERVVQEDLHVKGEYYVSLSYKPMIKDNLNLNIFNIEYFMQWGTPKDLEEFNWFSRLFKNKIKNEKFNKFLPDLITLIPAAGEGKRFSDNGYSLSKPNINVSEKPMLAQAIKDLPETNKLKIILRKNMNDLDYTKKKLIEIFPKVDIHLIDKKTHGQALTCLEGLKNIEENTPLMISACDNGAIYNSKKFKELYEDKTIDIIVWGCKSYPGAINSPNMYGWIEEQNNIIKKVHVKKIYKDPSIDPIIVGTFFFRKTSLFKLIINQLIDKKIKVNNEFYIDSAINNAIEIGFKVVFFEVDYYLCWGTPNDLNSYNYWQECFNIWDKHDYKKELDNDFE